jgi:apolipoprotein N-acyltransferase
LILKLLKACLLPGLSGLLLAGSFPKADQGYLAWVALVPLLVFVFHARSIAKAFAGGFAAGVIEFAILLIWMPAVLTHYGGVPAILAWAVHGLAAFVLAVYPGIACALTAYCIRRRGEICLFAFPFLWVVLEYIRGHLIVGGFPWLQMGYSQTNYLWLVQTADIAGVFGLSFVIVWTNSALTWHLLKRKRRLLSMWPLAAASVMIIGCAIYGRAGIQSRAPAGQPIVG